MSSVEKEKTLIHELLHIPGGFSGGFRPHKGYVERQIVRRPVPQTAKNPRLKEA